MLKVPNRPPHSPAVTKNIVGLLGSGCQTIRTTFSPVFKMAPVRKMGILPRCFVNHPDTVEKRAMVTPALATTSPTYWMPHAHPIYDCKEALIQCRGMQNCKKNELYAGLN